MLRHAVGQEADLICTCDAGGTCAENGNNDGCEGVDENPLCSSCCEESDDCDNACDAAMAISCDIDGLNETCAEQINEAGCGAVCCPGE